MEVLDLGAMEEAAEDENLNDIAREAEEDARVSGLEGDEEVSDLE